MSAMPKLPEPNVPAGYDPVSGAIWEQPWYDPNRALTGGSLFNTLLQGYLMNLPNKKGRRIGAGVSMGKSLYDLFSMMGTK